MSAFGQYVHYTWEGYKNYGTYMSETSWNTKKSRSIKTNFNDDIFDVHQSLILKQAAPIKNIKQLENEYNIANSKSFKRVQELMTEMSRGSLPAKESVETMLSILRENWTPQRLSSIMQNLVLDPATNNLKYGGQGYTGPKLTNSKSVLVKMPIPNGSQKKTLESLENTIQKIESSLKKDLGKAYATYEPSVERIKAFLQQERQSLINAGKILNSSQRNLLTPQSSRTAVIYINDLIEQFETVADINKILQERFAELIGTLSGFVISELTTTEIRDKVLKPLITEGRAGAQSAIGQGKLLKFKTALDQSTLSYFQTHGTTTEQSSIIQNKKGRLSIRGVGTSVSQKADVEFEFSNQETYGISIKNTTYELLSQNALKTQTIKAQSSSLALFLMGAQLEWDDLGTHYLNVLSQHYNLKTKKPVNPSLANQMRREAIATLNLAVVYSALSGANQARSGGQAQILAIYDKAKGASQRVKFFDIGTIVQKVATTNDQSMISPRLVTLKFANTWAAKNSTPRITKLLVETRSKTLSVQISKNFLSSLS